MRTPIFNDDLHFAEQCLEGRGDMVEKFRALCLEWLGTYLAQRGAGPGESDMLVQTLFVDCLAPDEGRRPLLATYRGECPLERWLARVGLHRLITLKRAEKRDLERFGPEPHASLESLAAAAPAMSEEPVVALLQNAVTRAFKECEADRFVILHLLHLHQLRQEEIATMFDCSIATISREAKSARVEVRAHILAEVRRFDPWLDLTWDDLVALCETTAPEALGV